MDPYHLLSKFFAQEISDEELKELRFWLEKDNKNKRIFNIENELWQKVSYMSRPTARQKEVAWKTIKSSVYLGGNAPRKILLVRRSSYRTLAVAASLAIIFLLGILNLWILSRKEIAGKQIASTIIFTKEKERSSIVLPDSSIVVLNSASKLEYNGQYNLKSRKVKLSGEAFFDVRTNSEKPFLVQLDQMTIAARGTRFNVFSYLNEARVEATLEEGSIEIVFEDHEPIQLHKGQQAVLFKDSNELLIRDVPVEVYLGWKENKMRFDDTPMEEVILSIQRRYNVDIEILDRDLLELKYTGTFIDESIDEVMEMLALVSPLRYRINHRTIETDMVYRKPLILIWKTSS